MAPRTRHLYLRARAERMIDPEIPVVIDGEKRRLADVPWYEPCVQAWLEAKARRYPFGWQEFPAFLRDMGATAPDNLEFAHVVLKDEDGAFVAENLEWRTYDDSWMDEPDV